MRISSLHTYPVKGCHRLDHDAARVQPWGLAGDRRWMIVDPDGVGITQRQAPVLTGLHAVPRPGGLLLNGFDVAEPQDGPKETLRVFSSKPPLTARLATAATEFVSDFLGRPARLAWLADTSVRPIETHALPGDRVSFADGFPLALANAASLDAVNDWLLEAGDEPVPMTRFRPNVVITGARPWAEDDWLGGRLRLGDVTFRVAKACSRCVVTTVDQETGEVGRQPLRALGRHRRYPAGLLFAIALIPETAAGTTAVLRVGESSLALS
ncbi:MOSC domain-containing protein [Actinoplanes sp. ATCC 53533]|uniref:MOSC domain-containing protein n=1 Tax=Actinoplanes sp. ATCC 53533 TaxID=1288362 RepID=UPI000F786F18|nr:MOSC N-terminal beta barrel domain-containing protein [Actinoplanes sp. ATCC 53533]RSM72689.1 MOSC domain-containing protein [Actinoplanes sp. ATCC 53533]